MLEYIISNEAREAYLYLLRYLSKNNNGEPNNMGLTYEVHDACYAGNNGLENNTMHPIYIKCLERHSSVLNTITSEYMRHISP